MTNTSTSRATRWGLGVALGCTAGCVASVLAVAGCGVLGYFWVRAPQGVSISVNAPIQVIEDEAFVIEVQVENLRDEVQVLHSIDIGQSYLAGLAIRGSDPTYDSSTRTDWPESLAFVSYYFYEDIAGHETLALTFNTVGMHAGDYSGTISVCINSPSNCSDHIVRTVVEAE